MSKLRPLCMPKWGIEMTEGTVAEWMVSDGQQVAKGDVLCLIETNKITNEVEAERDGFVLRIVEPAGEDARPVGTLLAVIGDTAAEEDEVSSFIAGFVPSESSGAKAASSGKSAKTKAPAKVPTNLAISPKALELATAHEVDLSTVEGSGRAGRITFQDVHRQVNLPAAPQFKGPADLPAEDYVIFATPLARRIAHAHGVDLAAVAGTGSRGRISKSDVLASLSKTPSAGSPFEVVGNRPQVEPFDKIRKVVARRLTEAKRDIPHFYLRISVRADALLAFRKTANLVLSSKASVNDYIVFAAGKALARHPEVNVQVHGEEIHRFPHADIAVAVASDKGLVTPIVRQVDRMRIDQLADASAALIDKARQGRLSYEDLDGGTFTVSNLGMYGIEAFDAVINPPQGAILAVGAATEVPCRRDDGSVGFEQCIALTLSVDHRAIDGAQAAQFLATLKGYLEAPDTLFA
ncbi:2-oxo acid dehydrogenase subunit E2 [Tsuneonella mangrovi]|uniref:2-oxo acid dehydrogenase subunit E2 n=1 Tax=Tsuneonella mangrovi TaxID=1982042 RepID=UPI000BA2AA1F|nr:2-oxo acid dehydrogenase subunit E2 [Tsuneonella mangrovi]